MAVRRIQRGVASTNSVQERGRQTRLMQAKLQLIANAQIEVARQQALILTYTAELHEDMKIAKIDRLEAGEATAEIVTPSGRAKNIIDPRGFRKAVKDDKVFFSCIEVLNSKAKEVLSGKELQAITTSIPAKVGEPVLKVTPVKVDK